MMEEIYSEFIEIESHASDKTKRAYYTMQDSFEAYLDAVIEDMFRNAYQYGYSRGLKDAQSGKVEGGALV